MGKIRIYELAKELRQDSKTIITELKKMDVAASNHMSTIDQADADKIRTHFANGSKPAEEKRQPKKEQPAKQDKQQLAQKQEKPAEQKRDQSKKGPRDHGKRENVKHDAPKHDGQNQKKSGGERHAAPAKKQKADGGHHAAAAAHPEQGKPQSRRNKQKPQKKDYASHEEEFNNSSSKKSRGDRDNRNHFGKSGKGKNKKNKKGQAPQKEVHEFTEVQHHVVVEGTITVQELAKQLGKKASEVIMKLMSMGMMATMNQELDFETAEIITEEYGATIELKATMEENLLSENEEEDRPEDLVTRPPVVTIMGHVDHGKTSLLDAIRNTSVTETEAGGITQHIGAYRVNLNGQMITFLDTPGHAAFTSMRARGAMATDIAVLVVAADDGIMPQTIEAINHAKAAGVSVIVAINKMDKPDASPDRVLQQLTEYDLVPEEWGGDVICVPVSAKTHMGIDKLLESILLVAEMLELKANPNRAAKGIVIEAKLDKGRGPVATLLVQNGTLRTGDIVVAGTTVGRVRVMTNERGKKLEEAGPSVPVEVMGLDEVPTGGDKFDAVSDEKLARELVEQRKHEQKEEQFKQFQKVTLDNLFSSINEGELKELNIIVKADVQGSVEAVRQSLEKLSNDEVKVKVIHGGVGAVSESDVMLAAASNAIIVGFNVRPDSVAESIAERDGVDMRMYRIIYDCIEEISDAIKGMLAPKYREVTLGKAEVRNVFKLSSAGMIAGSYVLDGKITRNSQIRVVRDGIVVSEDSIASLKRFKDDVKEVQSGYECGIGLEKFNDIKEGDILEAFVMEEYKD